MCAGSPELSRRIWTGLRFRGPGQPSVDAGQPGFGADPKTVYLQERAPSAATSLGVPANTRYAGKSLTINPVTS